MDPAFVQWIKQDKYNDFWENYQKKHPHQALEIQRARLIIQAAATLPVAPLSDDSRIGMWQNVQQKVVSNTAYEAEVPTRHTPFRSWVWWAAASIVLVSGWLGWQALRPPQAVSTAYEQLMDQTTAENQKLIQHTNASNRPMLISLPDGSSALLQKDSRISYSAQEYGTSKREVLLSGEAFFEVVKDPQVPFYVFANELVTKVLGTSFTVQAYEADREVNVFVKTGKVSVYTNKEFETRAKPGKPEKEAVVLSPNQLITLHRESLRLSRIAMESSKLRVPQTQTSFEFDDTPVTQIFKLLEETYGISIVYDQQRLSACKITASLTDEPLPEKIRLLCQGLGASYTISDKSIHIYSNGCN
ncbi:hypothetical protein HNQ92_004590 [Rhabdobacter roseus]|uniref:FecR family protein n=1 Tax=Rhabdobacter roseus TaxID=1655419 RepID=A0A840U2T0_9BACT|nr:hypothetical protein [Rhabdobacter roseus]